MESLYFYGFSVIIISYRVEQNIHMEEHMLELQNICYQVNDEDGDKEILRNVNLKIDDHFVVITGPNGGGK